ncbi:MAG: RagB/SusD family nutrient uptake outer membrane protein, partial [Bacteroidales bacterium]|nr:RagB/SusD family nutrient uptake outer membrane protein [Bacteroidales bacterium]
NPNEPTPEALKTEAGMRKGAYGIYNSLRAIEGTNDWFYYTWFIQWAHNVMGDATVSSVGNFGIRWANQTSQIIRPDQTIITPPTGGSQIQELNTRNARDYGADNVQAFEWYPGYSLIQHCNLMLSVLNEEVEFIGTPEVVEMKVKTYQAWFYFWKGFGYSRLGSIYSQGLIVDEYGYTNSNYLPNTALIDEAARNFNLAIDILKTIADNDGTYATIFDALIPAHFKVGNGGVLTPSMMIHTMNTYMARNILVNKYAADLTTADLNAIEELANEGITASDKIFTIRSTADDNKCLVYTTAWSGYRLNLAWERMSERLVQDFRPGDARFTRNITTFETPYVNVSGRGYQYGTRYAAVDAADGGEYMSGVAEAVEVPMACSYEENQLMLAEVKIRRDEVEAGLAHIDNVRAHQNAGLAALVGQGLTKEQALEELRSERRIGLFLKNVAFYDARRWGILKPLAQGGGRENANVVFEGGVVEPCTIEYNYKEWWDVPANETDFNPMTAGKGPGPRYSSAM